MEPHLGAPSVASSTPVAQYEALLIATGPEATATALRALWASEAASAGTGLLELWRAGGHDRRGQNAGTMPHREQVVATVVRALDACEGVDRLPDVRALLASVLLQEGRLAEAEAVLTKVTQGAHEGSASAFMVAAELAERRDDLRLARRFYEWVLAADVDHPQARSRLAALSNRLDGEDALPAGGASRLAHTATLLDPSAAKVRDRYVLSQEIGRGGAGVVFVAEDTRLGRPVALKLYHRQDGQERARLFVEGAAAARFEHPGIVRIFDLDPFVGALVMEWLPEGSVRHHVLRHGLQEPELRAFLFDVAEVLAFLHGRGVVHRDLKPSNLLLRRTQGGRLRVVLTDFGVAHALEAVTSEGGASAQVHGTLAYMAPEQRRGLAVTTASDIYALGVTLEEWLARLDSPPQDLAHLAMRCRADEPGQRPAAEEIVSQLSTF